VRASDEALMNTRAPGFATSKPYVSRP